MRVIDRMHPHQRGYAWRYLDTLREDPYCCVIGSRLLDRGRLTPQQAGAIRDRVQAALGDSHEPA
jgi:hypothetical protein